MHKKRILVTGSSGMLGTDLVSLLSHAYEVICTDIVENPASGPEDFIKCDITNRELTVDTVKKSKADVVIHTAAWTDVDGCELDKENALKVNSEGANNVALGCKDIEAVMFYISTDFVFDGDRDKPYKEDDETNPLNAYGLSKFRGEEAVRGELNRYFIVRTSWLFGKNGRNFVDIILDKAGQQKELRVVADQFGSPTFTKDLSKALEKLVSLSLKDVKVNGVFHFSNSGSCSWYRYAEEIIKIAGKDDTKLLPITSAELDRPAVRPKMSVLNTEKYSRFCNDTPRDWQSALRDYLINEQRIKGKYVQDIKK